MTRLIRVISGYNQMNEFNNYKYTHYLCSIIVHPCVGVCIITLPVCKCDGSMFVVCNSNTKLEISLSGQYAHIKLIVYDQYYLMMNLLQLFIV